MVELAKAYQALTHLLFLQISIKLINFVLNALIARSVSPDVYGEGQLKLNLILTVILHFSRETFRRAAERAKDSDSAVNMMWVSVATCASIGAATMFAWPGDRLSIICISAAGIIEAFCDPFYIISWNQFDTKTRAYAEGFGQVIRCVIVYSFIELGTIAFAVGQIVYSVIMVLLYYRFIGYIPIPSHFFIEDRVKDAANGLFVQAILNFFLSQGESLMTISLGLSEAATGVVAFVSNIASLIPRFIFRPIEDVTHAVFSKSMELTEAAKLSTGLVQVMWVLGCSIALYGNLLSDWFVRIIYGSRWFESVSYKQGAGEVLALYSIYICLLAVNGVAEAIANSISNNKDLVFRQVWMSGLSVLYVILSIFFRNYEAHGIVISCIIKTVVRVEMNLSYLRKSYSGQHVRYYPSPLIIIPFLIGYYIKHNFTSLQALIPLCMLLLIIQAALLYPSMNSYISDLRNLIKKPKSS